MPSTKITALAALTAAGAASNDLVVAVDVSDATMAATGTDKNMTFAQLAILMARPTVSFLVTDPNGDPVVIKTGAAYYRIPAEITGYNLTAVGAAVTTVSSSGLIVVQLTRLRAGVPASMLSTTLSIDATELDSSTAATPAVIDAANDDVQTGDQIRVDVTSAGIGARGLIIDSTFARP